MRRRVYYIIQSYSYDIKMYNNCEITKINYINEFKLYYSNDINIQDVQTRLISTSQNVEMIQESFKRLENHPYDRLSWLAVSRALWKVKHVNLNYVAWENGLKSTWSGKESVVCKALFYLKELKFTCLEIFLSLFRLYCKDDHSDIFDSVVFDKCCLTVIGVI